MEFKPKTEKDVSEAALAPADEYDFEVLNAEDSISKNNNPMIKVTIGIYIDGKVKNRIFDYLLPSMEAKLRHFCDTVGLLAQYEAGTLEAADCSGRSGCVRIAIAPAKGGYLAKNVVKDYVCRAAKPLASSNSKTPDPVDEGEIPF